jgi:hypothetical protein
VGKYLIPKLTTEEIKLIVNNTDTASTKVNLKPAKRYKFKKIVPQFKDKNKYLDDEEQAQIKFIEESFKTI